MSEIQYNQSMGTFSQVALIGLGAMFVTHALQIPPVVGACEKSNAPFLHQAYSLTGNQSTYNRYASITGEYIAPSQGFEQSVGDFYARLLINQEPLGAEFEKVLYENLWDLYES